MRWSDLCEDDQKTIIEDLKLLGATDEDINNWIIDVDKAEPGQDSSIGVFICGPSTKTCKCNCPESCEHDFTGEWVTGKEGNCEWGSATCSKCGMTSMAHDMWVGP